MMDAYNFSNSEEFEYAVLDGAWVYDQHGDLLKPEVFMIYEGVDFLMCPYCAEENMFRISEAIDRREKDSDWYILRRIPLDGYEKERCVECGQKLIDKKDMGR